jgi:hypothetical protein
MTVELTTRKPTVPIPLATLGQPLHEAAAPRVLGRFGP